MLVRTSANDRQLLRNGRGGGGGAWRGGGGGRGVVPDDLI